MINPLLIAVLGKSVYVVNLVDTVSIIDTTTDTVKQTIKSAYPIPHSERDKVYVQNKDSKNISIIYTGYPLLKSFLLRMHQMAHIMRAVVNIVASFDQKLAPESTMTVLLNNGVELPLTTVNDQQLSTNHTWSGPGDDIGDLTVRYQKLEHPRCSSQVRTNYTIPLKKISEIQKYHHHQSSHIGLFSHGRCSLP